MPWLAHWSASADVVASKSPSSLMPGEAATGAKKDDPGGTVTNLRTYSAPSYTDYLVISAVPQQDRQPISRILGENSLLMLGRDWKPDHTEDSASKY